MVTTAGSCGALLDEVHHRVVGVVGMVEQDVVLAQLVEDVGGLAAEMQRLGREGRELEVGPLDVAVEKHEAREIHGAIAAEDLVFVELEVDAQTLDDFRIGAGLDFEAHRIAFAAVVQLDANGFKQRARFFLLEVEVGVAGDAEGGVGQHLVAAIHAAQVLRDQILEQQVIVGAVRRGQADEPGQRAGNRDDPQHLRARSCAAWRAAAAPGRGPCSERAEKGARDRWRWG